MRGKRACAVLMLLACLALCVSCAQAQGSSVANVESSASSSGGAAESVEGEDIFSEGVDTPCTVSYSPYDGEYSSLFLSEGDKIAVIAPSGYCSRERVDTTVEGLKQWGYVPVQGAHVYDESYTLEDNLSDLVWALEDPSIKAVFCVRGGYGASEVQDALGLDLISSSKKLIIGFSDITVYHSSWSSAHVPSVHGAMNTAFTSLPAECVEAEQRLLRGELPSYTCECNGLCREGEAEGVLVGGNLSTLAGVIGTAYDCTQIDEPFILFVEDIGESVRHIHRNLTLLKHLGVLDKASGVVFGEWTDIPAFTGSYDGTTRGGAFTSMADMISRQILQDSSIPVAFGFPAGHGDVNYPLLMGARARLDVGSDSFTLNWI